METKSLGLIETLGLVGAIEAADAGTKAANVSFRGYQRGRAGLITVVFTGDVAAVRTAVAAGMAAAKQVGQVVSAHVIARPHVQLDVSRNGTNRMEHAPAPPTQGAMPNEPLGVQYDSEVTRTAVAESEGTAPSPQQADEKQMASVDTLAVAVAEVEPLEPLAEDRTEDWLEAAITSGDDNPPASHSHDGSEATSPRT